jgi:hypothetical protein
MIPKEKAEELVDKYKLILIMSDTDAGEEILCTSISKQCALIAVEFAREEFRNHCAAEIDTEGSPDDHFDTLTQEIEKL